MKCRRFIILLVASAAMAGTLCAQTGERSGNGTTSHITITGNARLDLLSSLGEMKLQDSSVAGSLSHAAGKRSPYLAGLFSIVVPGSGEFYTQSYWRAGGFLLAEAGLWVFYAAYYSKGNNQTTLFQNFADQHWSVVAYANWVQTYATQLNPAVTNVGSFLIPGTGGLPPWQQVDWTKLNAVENQVAQVSGNGFTHQLPHRPEQQYYELIGKYPQFAAGWDDAGIMTPTRIVNSDVSPEFLSYSKMRGKANDFYNIATTGSILLVVNHLLSALDAAWSATQFNHNLTVEAHLQPTVRSADFVEFVPTARISLSF